MFGGVKLHNAKTENRLFLKCLNKKITRDSVTEDHTIEVLPTDTMVESTHHITLEEERTKQSASKRRI